VYAEVIALLYHGTDILFTCLTDRYTF